MLKLVSRGVELTCMSTQKIPLDALQKIRQYIKTVLVLPESENHPRLLPVVEGLDTNPYLPEPGSLADLGDLFRVGSTIEEGVPMPNNQGRWFVSVTDPGVVFMKLPGLKLKPGFRLVGYLYRLDEEGVGKIWAVPEAYSATVYLEDALASGGQANQPPHPNHALDNYMQALQGDRSPVSFLIASLVRRELAEFGSLGKSAVWSKHQLINAVPQQLQWHWRTPDAIKDLAPKVRVLPDGRAIVEFFTCRLSPSIAIFQHLDQYAAGDYTCQGVDRPVAVGERRKTPASQ